MTRIMVIVGVALLLTTRAWAQSEANCEEIRQAVATYGYEEARRHALIHYGAEAVEAGEKKCLNIEPPAKAVTKKPPAKTVAKKPPAKHQVAKKPKHPAPPAGTEQPPRPIADIPATKGR